MTQQLRIDFVADLSCPWCAIGIKSLEQALLRVGEALRVDLHVQPFELNPALAPEGVDLAAYLQEKYGVSAEQLAANGEAIAARGRELGFTFDMGRRTRIYNTFKAHRLMLWAETENAQRALMQALFEAYFTRGENLDDDNVLLAAAEQAGLVREEAQGVLASGAFADDVREREQFFQRAGIASVPAIVINQRHLISGAQPVEVFERALREIAGLA